MANYLIRGAENAERLEILISMTSLTGEWVIKAIKRHLVDGMDEVTACAHYEIKRGNFDRSLKRVNEVAGKVIAYNALSKVV
jgi:hypothetical protein